MFQVNSGAIGDSQAELLASLIMERAQDRKAKMTPLDTEAADRLWKIWEAFRQEHKGFTQERIAEKWDDGDGGITQGAVSQYLRGKIPLNVRAVLRFSNIFGCRPQDIRTDLRELQNAPISEPSPATDAPAPSGIGQITAREEKLLVLFRGIGRRDQNTILDLANNLARSAKKGRSLTFQTRRRGPAKTKRIAP